MANYADKKHRNTQLDEGFHEVSVRLITCFGMTFLKYVVAYTENIMKTPVLSADPSAVHYRIHR